MARLFKWLVVAAAIAAVIAFLPIGGRSILERWQAARTPAAFVEKSWQELRAGASRLIGSGTEPKREGSTRSAKAARSPSSKGPASGKPVERHSEADREAIDEIVAKHVK
jgi:hypothetical protein